MGKRGERWTDPGLTWPCSAISERTPPPDWWPDEPPRPLRVWDFHAVINPAAGGPLISAEEIDEYNSAPPPASRQQHRTDMAIRDLMDSVFPGDSLMSIARRLGYSERGIRHLRSRFPDLATAMDMRRGAMVTRV